MFAKTTTTGSAAARAKSLRPRAPRSWADVARSLREESSKEAPKPSEEEKVAAVEAPTPVEKVQEPVEEPKAVPEPPVEAAAPASREPGRRGSRSFLCQGEVLVMLGHYGWLMSMDTIDHPDTKRNGGRIYVHRDDIAGGVAVSAGDCVAFYVYVDERGLGAEGVCLQGSDGEEAFAGGHGGGRRDLRRSRSCAAALRFHGSRSAPAESLHAAWNPLAKGLRSEATEFVPSDGAPELRAEAAEFVPTMRATAQEFVPSQIAVVAPSSGYAPVSAASPKFNNFFAVNTAYFSDDSDDDDSGSDSEGAPCAKRTSSSAGSSSTGVPSDSEEADELLEPPPGLPLPPGLRLPRAKKQLPAGFRPPPGLCLF